MRAMKMMFYEDGVEKSADNTEQQKRKHVWCVFVESFIY